MKIVGLDFRRATYNTIEMYKLAFFVVLSFMFLSFIHCQDFYQPEQIHLSYPDDPTQMVVTWSTFNDTNSTVCEYGIESLSTEVEGNRTLFTDGGFQKRSQYIHRVTLTDLVPGQRYWYHCGSILGWSDLFFFTALKSGSDWSPRFALYGDMGTVNGQALPYMQEDTQSGLYDVVIHLGDFAYDMRTNNGEVGDEFMRQIEPIAAYVPYMTCVGNHEEAYNFSHYKNRFSMPYEGSDDMFFSYNIGPIHFVAISSEFYFYQEYGFTQIPTQYQFLERDLKEANKPENRALRPWLIVYSHRALYCSNSDDNIDCIQPKNINRVGLPPQDLYGFENLFYLYGVDVYFGAHDHSYERSFPVFNRTVVNGSGSDPYNDPKSTVHITTGSGGCLELHDPFLEECPPWSAFRATDYGYTRMQVYNSSHLYLEQISVEKGGQVIDFVWISKSKHGPFPRLFPEENVY